MNYNRFTLSFIKEDSNLEKEFQYAYFQNSLKIVKATFLMAAIFYGLFGILDAILFPHTKKIAWIIRYAIVCPFTLSLFAFSYSRQFYKYWQVSQVFLIAMAGTGIIGMIVTAPEPANILYYAGLILVLMYGYTALIMRFIWASAAGWGIVLLYEIVALYIIRTPIQMFISNNFFLVTAYLVGMIASYSNEYLVRKTFYVQHLLEKQKAKVLDVNQELKSKVKELEEASAKIKTLSGLLPICSKCKKIRDDKGYWKQIEHFISIHSDAEFSHSIFPQCAEELYGDLLSYKMKSS